MTEPALLLHSDPGEVMDVLERCAGLDWRSAASPAEVEPLLTSHRPTVVFSIKHTGFPGAAHRPAILAPSVRWFHVGGSGIDHLAGYDASAVKLTTCAGVLAPFLAERALAALLYLSTGLDGFVAAQTRREWRPDRFEPLAGRLALIVGAGQVGDQLAQRLRALGVEVHGIAREPRTSPHYEGVYASGELDAWLPRADIVSVHLPLNEDTRGRLDAKRLALLRPGAIFLNSSRGAIVDEGALVERLRQPEGARLGGAWLDVFEEEPLPRTSSLWGEPRLLVTPHCADQVADFPVRFAQRFVELWSESSCE
ncbi:MAG: NAD(P)-dependent oxidoreductase [Planctomycetota bacterium]